jgi:low temperature requirement protein LtrA
VSDAERELEYDEHQVTPLELFFDLGDETARAGPDLGWSLPRDAVALYLLGHIAFLFRTTGRVFRRRTVGAAVLLALVPAAVAIPALAALALVSAVCSLVVTYEVIRYRTARVRVRHPELAE